ncbi:MAG: TatD family hydrolase [Caldilineaceae bacterium]
MPDDRPIERLPLFDSHAHLDLDAFDADRMAMLQRAAETGVQAVVLPGITLANSQTVQQMASLQMAIQQGAAGQLAADSPSAQAPLPRLFAAAGVHPNSSAHFAETAYADAAITTLKELSADPSVVAVGEIGLDNYWKDVEPAIQEEAFRRQLALAAELGKPVIVHSRDANAEVANVLRAWVAGSHFRTSPLAQRPFAGVLHAFSGDIALAEEAYAWGFALSLGGPVTFKGAKALHALAPALALNRLMLETDSPYLAPHPHRGARNEPANLPLVCQALAALIGSTPLAVAQTTTAVAVQFFGLESRL